MKKHGWQIILGASLVLASALFYYIHFLIFDDLHHIFIYMLGDIGFVFVEVLLVTLIIHRVLAVQEKKTRLQKLNMVIGAFFSEVGTSLLRDIGSWDPELEDLQKKMTGKKFTAISQALLDHNYSIGDSEKDWQSLKEFLSARRDFLLRLLENQNLLEHESFSDLLWAVFHLTEELEARKSLDNLPEADRRHLVGDAKRAYGKLAMQWLAYMEHLQLRYPYLFSLSLRTNPFDKDADATIQDAQ